MQWQSKGKAFLLQLDMTEKKKLAMHCLGIHKGLCYTFSSTSKSAVREKLQKAHGLNIDHSLLVRKAKLVGIFKVSILRYE